MTETETVNELTPDLGGRWLVTTQGSTHVWDLDAMTYTRQLGRESLSGPFPYDGIPMRITRVANWPKVDGRSVLFFDDPKDSFFSEQFRVSSQIKRIERLDDRATVS